MRELQGGDPAFLQLWWLSLQRRLSWTAPGPRCRLPDFSFPAMFVCQLCTACMSRHSLLAMCLCLESAASGSSVSMQLPEPDCKACTGTLLGA